jgi:HAD superfamily hydrolase (TIGR01509 family)
MPAPPGAVIFDFDGVIFDSETPEYESHRQVYASCGVALTVDEWCDAIGVWSADHDDRRFDVLCARAERAPTRDEYHARRHEIFERLAPRDPMPGILDLLARLDAARVAMAIASTAPARWVRPAVDRLGLTPRFRAIVTGDEVVRRKPAPDVYLEAARRVGVEPRLAVAIEDSAPGVAAARAAGLRVVAIPHWLTATHDLDAADLRVAHAGALTLDALSALIVQK